MKGGGVSYRGFHFVLWAQGDFWGHFLVTLCLALKIVLGGFGVYLAVGVSL